MIRHTNSFFLSLFLHLLLIGTLFFSYTYISSSQSKKEETVCIHLSCIHTSINKESISPKHSVKEEQKKVPKPKIEKKIPKKEQVHKKVIPKKIVPKKEIVPSIVQEVVREPEATKEKLKSHVVVSPQKSEIVLAKTEKISPEKVYVDENLAEIAQLLQDNLYYPRRARRRGVEGEVLVRFKLSVNAEVTELEVLSSQHDILSRGALKTIENLSSKFPKPKEALVLSVPIYYRLSQE